MSDEIERQLAAFGRTLEARTGEPIRPPSTSPTVGGRRAGPRWWAAAGAAACVAAVVVGLVLVNGSPDDQPAASPPPQDAGTSTSSPSAFTIPDDPLGLERDGWTLVDRSDEPFVPAELQCAPDLTELDGAAQVRDALTSADGSGLEVDVSIVDTRTPDLGRRLAAAVGATAGCAAEAVGVGVGTAALHDVPSGDSFRVGADFALVVVAGPERTVVFELEGAPFGDELIVDLAERAGRFITGAPADPPTPTTVLGPFSPGGGIHLGDDPLELEPDGWTTFPPDDSPFEYDLASLPVVCPQAAPIESYNGTAQVVVQGERGAIMLDAAFLDLGSLERAVAFADAFLAIEPCLADAFEQEVSVVSLSSIRASWLRVGEQLAIGTVLGPQGETVLLAVEGEGVDDDVVADLAHRADRLMRSEVVSPPTSGELAPTLTPLICPTTYVLEGGTTRVEVAARFGLSYQELDAANRDTPGYPQFVAGTEIVVPCPGDVTSTTTP